MRKFKVLLAWVGGCSLPLLLVPVFDIRLKSSSGITVTGVVLEIVWALLLVATAPWALRTAGRPPPEPS